MEVPSERATGTTPVAGTRASRSEVPWGGGGGHAGFGEGAEGDEAAVEPEGRQY